MINNFRQRMIVKRSLEKEEKQVLLDQFLWYSFLRRKKIETISHFPKMSRYLKYIFFPSTRISCIN